MVVPAVVLIVVGEFVVGGGGSDRPTIACEKRVVE